MSIHSKKLSILALLFMLFAALCFSSCSKKSEEPEEDMECEGDVWTFEDMFPNAQHSLCQINKIIFII